MRLLASLLALLSLGLALAQEPSTAAAPEQDVFSTSNCMGCHGQSAMGGLGPPIAQTKLTAGEFLKVVREGKGMMPATKVADAPDSEVNAIYDEVKAKPWVPELIPISYKVGQFLTTRSTSHIFILVTLFAMFFAIKNLSYWFRAAGFAQLWPRLVKMGLGKSFGIALKALIVDGFFVISLWKKSKVRWAMHGLILYGFVGLMIADIMQFILNPTRQELGFSHPVKLLAVLSGVAVFAGLCYVVYRYKRDDYIDNGLTLGRDFLFLNLMLNTIFSGFLTIAMKRFGLHDWVMTVYIYHLCSIALLIATAPFTRFQHVWVVPIMVAMTRLAEAVTKSGVDIGFEREPSPGRHHKTERIARNVLDQLGSDYEGSINIRYYP